MRRVLFLVFTAILTVVFFIALGRDQVREWNVIQSKFFKTLEKQERRGVSGGIKQVIVKDLGRVDRCATCHIAIDKPQLALAEEPFTAHPGKYLEWHPVDKFGCTVCHGGQGLATETLAAHGDVKHWEEPLLRGPLVQSSCTQCHGDVSAIAAEAPLVLKGKQLFKELGCLGCHAVKDAGQTVSVDLSEVGSKSHQLIEADFENMPHPHNRIHWLKLKLHNPRTLNPGVTQEHLPLGEEEVFPSGMPNFSLNDEEIQALTTYLLSLTEFNPPVSYTIPPEPEIVQTFDNDVDRGRHVFQRLGCAGCHGAGGAGGRRNWNNGLGEEVPPLFYVKAYYGNNIEALKTVIRNGRQPSPRMNAQRPNPALYMPAWKDKMTDNELNALIAYLFSLSAGLPESAAAPAPEDEPQADTQSAVSGEISTGPALAN